MKGMWSLRSPGGLFQKLEADYQRMKAEPRNPFPAFDFFVTGYHMLDWYEPNSKPARDRIEQSEPVLRLAGHLATGVKHFESRDPKWTSVSETPNRIARTSLMGLPTADRLPLIIRLTEDEAAHFPAREIQALVVAKLLLDFWRVKLGL